MTLCKNCNHKIIKLDKDSFLKKYKDGNLWCHAKHKLDANGIPIRQCKCGCNKPEQKTGKLYGTKIKRITTNQYKKLNDKIAKISGIFKTITWFDKKQEKMLIELSVIKADIRMLKRITEKLNTKTRKWYNSTNHAKKIIKERLNEKTKI